MSDAHTAMVNLSVELATKASTGRPLSEAERAIADVLWVHIQVSANGFDGWLQNTDCQRMRRTLAALMRIGCPEMTAIVKKALSVARIELSRMSDADRERRMRALSEPDRERLMDLDGEFYNALGSCMDACQAFVEKNRANFV